MRKPLEKNEFLLQFEALLKKHGCSTVYCESGFGGTKKCGMSYYIDMASDAEAVREFQNLLDPTISIDECAWWEMCSVWVGSPSMHRCEPIYLNGEFYASGDVLLAQKPLEKNEFLLQFDALLKKHGYCAVYCDNAFDGTKAGGRSYVIAARRNRVACRELNALVDPTWGLVEFNEDDVSTLVISPVPERTLSFEGECIYDCGEFYAVGGGEDIS